MSQSKRGQMTTLTAIITVGLIVVAFIASVLIVARFAAPED
jgi:hypothetical protein